MMNGKKFPTEAKVGLFVILTIISLAYLSIRINRTGIFFKGARTAYIIFEDVSGLVTQTPVEFSGVRVGYIEEIELINQKARVTVHVDSTIKLYEDTQVTLSNRGILGEKIISISDGGDSPELEEGGTLIAISEGADFDKAVKNINNLAEGLNEIIRGDEGEPSLKNIIENVTMITDDVRDLVGGNVENLDRIIKNLDSAAGNVKDFMDGAGDMSQVGKNFGVVMAKLDDSVSSLNRILIRVEAGEGTVGKLLSDDSTINKVDDALDGINDFLGSVNKIQLQVGFRGEYLSTEGQFQPVASFKIWPAADKYFLLEFTDGPLAFANRVTTVTDTTTTPPGTKIVEEEVERKNNFQITALFAHRFYDLTLKAGLFRSSGGMGAEYHLFRDRVSLGVDSFDFNRDENPHVRLFATAHLFKVFQVSGGVDDVIHSNGRRNYFGSVGIMLTDNDLKNLFGLGSFVN